VRVSANEGNIVQGGADWCKIMPSGAAEFSPVRENAES